MGEGSGFADKKETGESRVVGWVIKLSNQKRLSASFPRDCRRRFSAAPQWLFPAGPPPTGLCR